MVFKCKKNCGDCCGAIPIHKKLWEKHRHLLPPKVFVTVIGDYIFPDSTMCVYLDENKNCMIYKDRPGVCRTFGSKELPCPFLKPSGKLRSIASKKKIMRLQDDKLDDFLNMARGYK